MAYCTNPSYFASLGFVACGKCHGCLQNKKKEMSDRLFLEKRSHSHNYFVSVTYAPENLPDDMCVSKKVARDWVKRISYYCGYTPTHFGCGEYGDESAHPHYHCIVFADSDVFEQLIQSWTFGRVEVAPLTLERCRYTAGYVVKKMTKSDDPRLEGRTPEFWFGSKRPPVGYRLLYDLLEKVATDDMFKQQFLTHVYPPSAIRMDGRWIRLPRYIRDKLKPLFKMYNEDKQNAFCQEKKYRDAAILKQIAQNVQSMSMKWNQIKIDTYDKRKALEGRCIKAYNIKKRRII